MPRTREGNWKEMTPERCAATSAAWSPASLALRTALRALMSAVTKADLPTATDRIGHPPQLAADYEISSVRRNWKFEACHSSDERLAASNRNRRSGDVAGHRVRQHDIGRREFSRLARPLHWHLFAEILDGVVRHCRGDKRRPDRTGRDRIGPNGPLPQHLREAPVKFWIAPFVRIGEQDGIRHAGIDRRSVNDGAPGFMCGTAPWSGRTWRGYWSEKSFPFFVADISDLLKRRLVGRVVDKDVDAAQSIDGSLNNLAAMMCIFQVARHQDCFAAFLLNQSLDLLRLVGLARTERRNFVLPLPILRANKNTPDNRMSPGVQSREERPCGLPS
jgi:hypothetical protein